MAIRCYNVCAKEPVYLYEDLNCVDVIFPSLQLQRLVEDIEYVDLCHKAAGELLVSPFIRK